MTTAVYVSIAAYVVILLGAAAFLGIISKAYLDAKAADEEEARMVDGVQEGEPVPSEAFDVYRRRAAMRVVNEHYGRK